MLRLIQVSTSTSSAVGLFKETLLRKVKVEKINPKIYRTLSNFSEDITEEVEFLKRHKEDIVKEIITGKKQGEISIKIKDIILQPSIVRKDIFRELFILAGGNIKKLTFRHWKEAECLMTEQDKGKSLNFPGKICVTRTRTSIVFNKMTNNKGKSLGKDK